MILNSETRRRHRFVDQSIEGARRLFVDNPHVRLRLGEFGNALVNLCNISYVPNIKDNLVTIPKKYRGELALPIMAMRPGEVFGLAPEFALLTPMQRSQAARQIDSWQPKRVTPQSMVAQMEQDAWELAQSTGGLKFGNLFTNQPRTGAQTGASPIIVPLNLDAFKNARQRTTQALTFFAIGLLTIRGTANTLCAPGNHGP